MLWQYPRVSQTLVLASLVFPAYYFVLSLVVHADAAAGAVVACHQRMEPIPIHAYNPGPMTGDGNWTWLLRGRLPTLVDAGTGDPRFLDGVAAALDGARLAQVLVTHAHGDHSSGVLALAERFPGSGSGRCPGRDATPSGRWRGIRSCRAS